MDPNPRMSRMSTDGVRSLAHPGQAPRVRDYGFSIETAYGAREGQQSQCLGKAARSAGQGAVGIVHAVKDRYPSEVGKPRPHAQTYWVHEHLLAGEYPGAPDDGASRVRLRAYLDAGVDFFVDLTRTGEMPPYDALLVQEAAARRTEVTYHHLSVPDMGVPTPLTMATILDTIDEAIVAGRTVYVHCWGGVGRTGTVVGCYLVRHGRTGVSALAEIARLWPIMSNSAWHARSPETGEQVRFVRNWREAQAGG
jgi:hypothetical protein